MSKQATQADTGFRDRRVEFVREDEPGVPPENPEWELFSDTLETALEWDGDAQIEAQRGVGDYRIQNHFTGAEDHSASIEYSLQRFFVDEDGEPLDPAGDAILRADDGGVRNTHTVVDRAEFDNARTYVVARGCHPDLSDLSGDPGSALPMTVSLDYEVRGARMFRVYQPDGEGEALTVRSESDEDTNQTLTLESDGALTSEEVALDGTTGVTTEEVFDSLDAFELDASTDGDVIIEDSEGEELTRLRGADSYGDAEGDIGVPALGDGSHSEPIGSSYERFLDDKIEQAGSALAAEVRSASFSVDNNYDKDPIMGTSKQAIHIGEQDVDFSATVAGDFAHHENLVDHFTGETFDLTWEMDGGTLTFVDAVLESPGSVGPSAGDVISTMDNTFEPVRIELDAN